MPNVLSHRLSWRLLTLSILSCCLLFLFAGPETRATSEDCCISEYNTCNSGCAPICDSTGCHNDVPCETNCNQQFADCSAPGPPGCQSEPLQPKTPCQGCLDNCDVMQANCVAEGTQTPFQCAYAAFRCRQSCNYYCAY